ncbi:unnamed protein product [Vicia faba]|uniref:Uncharacterized protein n=1 Tax=Vicia faba TaxID=3906 RepID=A0AAV1AQK0_VICFA|nr:unnamed protein product [Vicia faba]
MEKLTKSHDKSTHEKDHMVKVNDNIDNGVRVYEGSITMNNGVHAGFEQVIEDTTEHGDPYKNMLKRKYVNWIATEIKTPREALTFEESNQGLNKIVDNKEILSIKMSFYHEENMMKRKCLFHKKIGLERKFSKEVLTFEEVVQLLEKVCDRQE